MTAATEIPEKLFYDNQDLSSWLSSKTQPIQQRFSGFLKHSVRLNPTETD